MSKAVLYDATLCIGCRECERACARYNGLEYDDAIAEEQQTSERKFTFVRTLPDDKFMRKLCMHCVEPACASVCPVAAMTKSKDGPVVYDKSRCMGCRYCLVACPFDVPKYQWSELVPLVRKCTMCSDRLAQGLPTSCSEACPTGATITGDRDTLLAEAKKRIADNPSGYVNHIFGETEVGGTSVLMLSSIPFVKAGFRAPEVYGKGPMPANTWKALSKIPDVVSLGFVALGGIWWITNRRHEVAAADHAAKKKQTEAAKPTGGES